MDPYGQQQQHQQHNSISSNDFLFDLQQGAQQSQPVQQPSLGPRQYKSRKFRPCDFCRARQVACKIETAPPCNLCANHNRECTFVEQPKKKRRPNPSSSGDSIPTPTHTRQHSGHIPNGITAHEHNSHVSVLDPALAGLEHNIPPHHRHSLQLDNGYMQQFQDQVFDPQLMQDHQFLDPQIQAFSQSPIQNHYSVLQDPSPDFTRTSPHMSIGLQDRPLDYQANRSARFVGETGESNPYLLRHYRYDENDECTISKLTYRRIKKYRPDAGKGEPPVVFMLADDAMASKGEPRVDDNELARIQQDLLSIFTEEEALRLIGLYFRFVNPYFQILPRSEFFINNQLSLDALRRMPISLRAVVCATAIPFILYDDLLSTTLVHNQPPTIHLYRIAWAILCHELHSPRLATLQTCLLLLQRPPTNRYVTDTPFKSSLLGLTVSLAQSLGIHQDPSDWSSLPVWEINLRKRLWHAVYIVDKWVSLGAGTPCLINPSSFDVPPLLPSDCDSTPEAEASPLSTPLAIIPGPTESEAHFRLLSKLTVILSDIIDAYYTLSASKRTSKDFALTLELAWPLRSRLKSWNDSLPPSLAMRREERVDSRGLAKLSATPSLSLAYIVATMTLYRALLRPLLNADGGIGEGERGIEGSVDAAREGARACAREVVEFVEGLGRGSLEGFWHSFSRANFAIASSFLMQLHLTSHTDEEKMEISDLVNRWRWAMRVGSSGTGGNGLMSLGLLRMDGLMREEMEGGDGQRRATVA